MSLPEVCELSVTALDVVSKRSPGLIRRFGGHAQAAGLSIGAGDYARFAGEFERTVDELLPPSARLRHAPAAAVRQHHRPQSARMAPPSTGSITPVTYEAAGDSKNAAAAPPIPGACKQAA